MLSRLLVLGFCLCVMSAAPMHGAKYRVTDHCDGSKFFNPEKGDPTFSDHLKWLTRMKTVEWPEWVSDPKQAPPPKYVGKGRLRITCINQSTVLIQTDGVNLLTDPIWSSRAGPVRWMGASRVRAPGVAIGDLPKIDVMLLSHNHYDHLELRTLREICGRDHPLILTGLGNRAILAKLGASAVVELDWWEEHKAGDSLTVRFVPARHQSGRGLLDGNRSLWGGFTIRSAKGTILFQGDTDLGSFFQEIAKRSGPLRLAILPLGNYEPRFMMKAYHMSPEDAVKARAMLGSPPCLGIHVGVFREHPEQAIDSPWKDLAEALRNQGIPAAQFRIPAFGEGIDID